LFDTFNLIYRGKDRTHHKYKAMSNIDKLK